MQHWERVDHTFILRCALPIRADARPDFLGSSMTWQKKGSCGVQCFQQVQIHSQETLAIGKGKGMESYHCHDAQNALQLDTEAMAARARGSLLATQAAAIRRLNSIRASTLLQKTTHNDTAASGVRPSRIQF